MGSIGNKQGMPEYDSYFKHFLDNAGGDMEFAMKDYISDAYFYETVEAPNGTEYEILDDAGMFVKVVEEATPEHKIALVTVELYVKEKGTNKKPKWWVVKDRYNPRKAKLFEIQIYQ